MAEKRINKPRDIEQTIRYLTHTFNKVLSSFEKPAWTKTGPNAAYKHQTEFAYLLNELMQSPEPMRPINVAKCNEYIDLVMQEKTTA